MKKADLKRDIEIYKKMAFHFMIIDEAQAIKNYQTKNSEAVKEIRCVKFSGEKNIFFEGDVLNFYYPSMKSDVLKEVYLEWLKEEAEKKFEEVMDRIHPMVAEYRIKRPQIKVRNMKSIWGSCTTTGSAIRLNLQLMKADEACIEQVVLHELLHFRYPNHGKSFYDLLEQLMPDWKERKEKLEKNFKDGV